jgi:hypothetical protein
MRVRLISELRFDEKDGQKQVNGQIAGAFLCVEDGVF